MTNTLYYGDNLDVLRAHVADASVDLVYLDPPFNSNASYNILFKSPAGKGADASIEAFDDTWVWGPSAEDALVEIAASGNFALKSLLDAMERFIGKNAMMAYLAMMAVRLIELHRVLKPTGSLYLHCDPTASHYLKLVLDAVFGVDSYRNEVVWKRTPFAGSSKARAQQFPRSHDVILFYTKSVAWTWNSPTNPYSAKYLARFKWDDDDGKGPYRKTLLKTYSQATINRLSETGELIQPVRSGAGFRTNSIWAQVLAQRRSTMFGLI